MPAALPLPAKSKHRKTVALIRALALQVGPGGKLPTVRELSAQLAVAKATVDDALDLLEARHEIHRKHGSGIYVQPAIRQRTIGVVFGGDIFSAGYSPFWSLLFQAIRQQTGERDLRTRAYMDIAGGRPDLGSHHQLVEDLQAERLEALLLVAPQSGWHDLEFVRNLTIPLVTLDSRDKGWVACFDEKALLRLAAQEVATYTNHRRVALLGVEPNHESLQLELQAAGCTTAPLLDWSYLHWVSQLKDPGGFETCAHRLVTHLIATEGPEALPEVIISTEDTMTRGAVTALRDAGISIGTELQIVTAENLGSPVLTPYADCLTRIGYDPAECIRAALGMIELLIEGGRPTERMTFIPPRPPIRPQ